MSTKAQWIADEILPHERALRDWLRRRLPRGLDLDDVVQETYAVLADVDDVGRIASPRAYLFTTANSIVLQLVRRAQVVSFETVAGLERLEAARDDFDPERHAVAGEELRRIADLIRSLPEKCRNAFVLRKVHGLSQREIASRMGISENTVEKHICKGLRVLMDEMKGQAPSPARGSGGDHVQQVNRYGHHEEH